MNNNSPPVPEYSQPRAHRIVSIDFFRGLTMLVMLFVNDIGDADLGNIQNAPWWLHHAPLEWDGMTMPDVIFPAFLFIVGLAIPTALSKRIDRGDSILKLLGHIVVRSLALIFIGICMANACHSTPLDEQAMGISGPLWRFLFFISAIVFWNRYPSGPDAHRKLFIAMRLGALAVIVYLVVIFRADQNGEPIWLRPRWWGIVGLIGWSYLIAALVWLMCRDRAAALIGAMALLVTLDCGARSGAMDWIGTYIDGYQPGLETLGGLSAIVVAGMLVATLFRPSSTVVTPRGRIGAMLVFAAGMAAAGFLLRPSWGIHKLSCSPSWILYSSAIACVVYALLYGVIDIWRCSCGTGIIKLAGSNTLLMYMLPHIFYASLALLGIDYLQTHLNEGWTGVARAASLAVSFVCVTAALTRCRVRLQL